MLLVVLGAGASHDSDPARPASSGAIYADRPPLTDGLFTSSLVTPDDHRGCIELFPQLRRAEAAHRSVEDELETIRQESETSRPSHRPKLVALRDYLAAVITTSTTMWANPGRGGHGGITSQLDLMSRVDKWREPKEEAVAVVTFNYDTLADRAVEAVAPGLNLNQPERFVDDSRYHLFKLHGSVDWWRRVDDLEPVDTSADRRSAAAYMVGGDLSGRGGFLRAISIPLGAKTDSHFECPDEHLERLKADLPTVTQVLSIGWRGHEAHFWKLWEENAPKDLRNVLVVSASRETATVVARMFSGQSSIPKHVIRGDGFSSFLREGALEKWLRLQPVPRLEARD